MHEVFIAKKKKKEEKEKEVRRVCIANLGLIVVRKKQKKITQVSSRSQKEQEDLYDSYFGVEILVLNLKN